jgi:hypothetical protein
MSKNPLSSTNGFRVKSPETIPHPNLFHKSTHRNPFPITIYKLFI